jgi:hypothetical protein
MKKLFTFACLLFTLSLHAQDANYWSASYGPGGFFMPGAVIANNKDSGVLFYNPALLALSHKKTTSISGTVYQLQSIKIADGAGDGKDLRSKVFSTIPQMLTGNFSLNKKKPFYISYAIINNPVISYRTTQRVDAHINVLDDRYSPGPEFYVGQYIEQNSVNEMTALVSTGFVLKPGLSAGLSVEGQTHRQHRNFNSITRALINTGDSLSLPMASNDALYDLNYTHIGLKFKGGLAYDAGRHHLGLVLTSPLIHVGGSGTLLADNAVNNIPDTASGDNIHFLANLRQTGLKPKWKMPFSVAFGYAYDHGKGQLYFAAEYFHSIKEYSVIVPKKGYFLRPDTGDNDVLTDALLRLKDARKAVVNFAAGFSYSVRPDITAYCGFRTDFTYADKDLYINDAGNEVNTSLWNIFHCQLGANLKRKKYNLRVGVLLSYGHNNEYPQAVNFTNANETNLLTGEAGLVPASYFQAGLTLGYIHNL